jgi:hypothetical protein
MDDGVKLENAYKTVASKRDGEMNESEGGFNSNSKEVVSKDDLSPLPEPAKQKNSDSVEATKRKNSDTMEASRKKLNFESQTTNNDKGYHENEYEHEYEDEDYDNE